eukprot:TRINITY_DN11278_c0_g1_i1.p1 TRINITY_DN11278_c0_g1~~TRINITY_DN11278_c0_g1_i1.p1  ORF type:complete len:1228 (+),score=289.91 TRINITY_DN11278_c0_g1_i1:134-3685(+)
MALGNSSAVTVNVNGTDILNVQSATVDGVVALVLSPIECNRTSYAQCNVYLLFPAVFAESLRPFTITFTTQASGVQTVEDDTSVLSTNDCPYEGFFGTIAKGCSACPVGGDCPGGNRIWPKYGFWNPSDDAGWVGPCILPDRCPGLPTGRCADFQTAAFCSRCNQTGYTTDPGNEALCRECNWQDSALAYFFVFLLVFTFLSFISMSDTSMINVEYMMATLALCYDIFAFPTVHWDDWLNLPFTGMVYNGFDFQFLGLHCLIGPEYLRFDFMYYGMTVLSLVWFGAVFLYCIAAYVVMYIRNALHEEPVDPQAYAIYYSLKAQRVVTFILSITYSVYCDRTFNVYFCLWNNDGNSHLYLDQAQACLTDSHVGMLLISFLFVSVIIVGYPAWMFYQVYDYMQRNPPEAALKPPSDNDDGEDNEEEDMIGQRKYWLLWGLTPFVYSLVAALDASIGAANIFFQLSLNSLILVIYGGMMLWQRPFGERWKNIVQLIMVAATIVSMVGAWIEAIMPNVVPNSANVAMVGTTLLVSFVVMFWCLFVLLLSIVEGEWPDRFLKFIAGPKNESGQVMGASELVAGVIRARADDLATTLAEPLRQAVLLQYREQAGRTANLTGPGIAMERTTVPIVNAFIKGRRKEDFKPPVQPTMGQQFINKLAAGMKFVELFPTKLDFQDAVTTVMREDKADMMRRRGELIGPDVEFDVPNDVIRAVRRLVGRERTRALPDQADTFWDQDDFFDPLYFYFKKSEQAQHRHVDAAANDPDGDNVPTDTESEFQDDLSDDEKLQYSDDENQSQLNSSRGGMTALLRSYKKPQPPRPSRMNAAARYQLSGSNRVAPAPQQDVRRTRRPPMAFNFPGRDRRGSSMGGDDQGGPGGRRRVAPFVLKSAARVRKTLRAESEEARQMFDFDLAIANMRAAMNDPSARLIYSIVDPSDDIDIAIANFVNVKHKFHPTFHLVRMAPSWYEFGRRRIHVAVINGMDLVVLFGAGGQRSFEEFVERHEQHEQQRYLEKLELEEQRRTQQAEEEKALKARFVPTLVARQRPGAAGRVYSDMRAGDADDDDSASDSDEEPEIDMLEAARTALTQGRRTLAERQAAAQRAQTQTAQLQEQLDKLEREVDAAAGTSNVRQAENAYQAGRKRMEQALEAERQADVLLRQAEGAIGGLEESLLHAQAANVAMAPLV